MTAIKIGTCGYQYYTPPEDWKHTYESKLQAYSDVYQIGELNRTFYKLPQVSTTNRWVEEAARDFEFSLKAWQAVTHPWRSPTWNNYRDAVPDTHTGDVGDLKPTEFAKDAWNRTIARARSLSANVIIVQTPPSFDPTPPNEANMREFFTSVDRDGVAIGWEPRGEWKTHPKRVQRICEDLDLLHVVDIMREEPVADHPYVYTRLHGLNEDPYDYDYAYSDTELEELAAKLRSYAGSHEHVYCLFNNYEMYANARQLRSFLD